jgi:hypothetical protein
MCWLHQQFEFNSVIKDGSWLYAPQSTKLEVRHQLAIFYAKGSRIGTGEMFL